MTWHKTWGSIYIIRFFLINWSEGLRTRVWYGKALKFGPLVVMFIIYQVPLCEGPRNINSLFLINIKNQYVCVWELRMAWRLSNLIRQEFPRLGQKTWRRRRTMTLGLQSQHEILKRPVTSHERGNSNCPMLPQGFEGLRYPQLLMIRLWWLLL